MSEVRLLPDRDELRALLWRTAWAPVAVVVFHQIGSSLFGHEPWIDTISHSCGGAAIAFCVRRGAALVPRSVGDATPLALDALAFGLASAVAVFWELAEWASDAFRGTTIQVDVADPLRDLALGQAGALALLILAAVVPSLRSSTRAPAGTSGSPSGGSARPRPHRPARRRRSD